MWSRWRCLLHRPQAELQSLQAKNISWTTLTLLENPQAVYVKGAGGGSGRPKRGTLMPQRPHPKHRKENTELLASSVRFRLFEIEPYGVAPPLPAAVVRLRQEPV